MARKKGSVIGVEEDPEVDTAAPRLNSSLETPSGSYSTSSTNPTCPRCNCVFHDMPITDFRNHVTACTLPSTAGDDDASSILTTPPASPSQPSQSLLKSADADEGLPGTVQQKKFNSHEVRRQELEVAIATADGQDLADKPDSEPLKDPRPYINPENEFEYYDQTEQPEHVEPQEGSDADQIPQYGVQNPIQNPQDIAPNRPDASQKSDAGESGTASENPSATQKASENVETRRFPFAKVTEIEVFEKYLENAEDMTYDELYRRTAVVSDVLNTYQKEWDAIDKEIYEHESNEKSEQRRIEEETKAMIEEDRLKDDAERDEVAEKFKTQLKLSGKKWQEFMAESEDSIPNKTIRHLQNLRNPQFMAAARKKQQAAVNKAKRLLNAPWPEVKKTKEDLEWERRQRGRYMDPVKFDDMKQADVYGFEYSAHIKHYGQQPTAVVTRQVHSNPNPTSNPAGEDTNDAGRSRTQRNTTRKKYGDDASATPEESPEEDDQKLQKRIRKPKIYIDGVETAERSRGQSRSGTPPVRTFKSGKRVGRPPAKSKLQAVQLAQPSTTPEVASGNESLSTSFQKELEHHDLAPTQEAQLHDAAESLVSQTQTSKASAGAIKRKHAGGRPKKTQLGVLEVAAPEVPQQRKRKHAGGRPKKNPISAIPVDVETDDLSQGEQEPLVPKPKKRRGRVKKETIPEDDLVQLGEENVLQSTEQDDGSHYSSAVTSRPTTSDSNATTSTFNSRRSARTSTREKTNAREARASVNRRGSNTFQSSSLPTSTRSKRKRASSETDPSPIVVEPIQFTEQPSKKRKTRGKQDPEDVIEALPEVVSQASAGRSTKRKRGDTINESIAVAGPIDATPIDFAPPPKKAKVKVEAEEKAPEVEEVDSDADVDEDSLDPIALAAFRKKRKAKEKSKKLSESMKFRWANGGMATAQETRTANNKLKKAHKEQSIANKAAGLPPPPPPVLVKAPPKSGQASVSAAAANDQPVADSKSKMEPKADSAVETPATATPTPDPVSTKRKRTKSKSKILPPKRPASTRARKPTRVAMGFDGANDEDDEEDDEDDEQRFTSEYDQYQALTSPRTPVLLGKRVRKSMVDLSQYMDSGDEEDLSG
ncbi:hypothetical protein D0Z07_2077 [Hyphodiscus hymeniophilus]|uniref:Uncharacterized protein n=1 Tax=Hyphodiscus hymeniophilus TaxID=353542 RepID=A0A9P7AZR5_9HELO|nr:hypothetical protein D0Z07_2077 [Hyphodiscus hymeniophilus]